MYKSFFPQELPRPAQVYRTDGQYMTHREGHLETAEVQVQYHLKCNDHKNFNFPYKI